MRDIYAKVTQIAREQLYQFMKDNQISPLNYNFEYFFENRIQKFNIRVMEHHFTNRKIEGLTMIDEAGISISYESQTPQVKQNFTKCHELGHYILGHSGNHFTEMADNKVSIDESEANLFSAFILMPDIVLLSKIFYRRDSFQQVVVDLAVSAEAFKYRLQDLLRFRLNADFLEVNDAISKYQAGQNKSIFELFDLVHSEIEDEYRSIEEDTFSQIINKLSETNFVSSTEFPKLLDNNFRKELENEDNIGAWLEYDFGQSIGYAWRTDKLTEQQARSRAKTILLIEKR